MMPCRPSLLMERSIWHKVSSRVTATYRHWRLLSRDEILARQEKGGDDKCNIANNTRGGQRSLSQITYVLSEKNGGYETH